MNKITAKCLRIQCYFYFPAYVLTYTSPIVYYYESNVIVSQVHCYVS